MRVPSPARSSRPGGAWCARSRSRGRLEARQGVGRPLRARIWPTKSISTSSTDRRPIFRPKAKAPSGLRRIGIEGWPTRPRRGLPRRTSSSCLQRAHDHRCGLRREAGTAGDIGLGEFARAGGSGSAPRARCGRAGPDWLEPRMRLSWMNSSERPRPPSPRPCASPYRTGQCFSPDRCPLHLTTLPTPDTARAAGRNSRWIAPVRLVRPPSALRAHESSVSISWRDFYHTSRLQHPNRSYDSRHGSQRTVSPSFKWATRAE